MFGAGDQSESVLGYQQTGCAAATALTIPAGTKRAEVLPLVQAVRWRADGTDPTAAIGQPIAAGVEKRFDIVQLARLKFIEQVATASLNVTYYG